MKSKTVKIVGCVFIIVLLIITLYFSISDITNKDTFDFTQYTSQQNSVQITTGESIQSSNPPTIKVTHTL